MIITHELTVDVRNNNIQMIRVTQYSKDTHKLVISITDKGNPLTFTSSAYEAHLKVAGAGGNFYYLDTTILNNKVNITLPESVVAFSGRHQAQVDLIETANQSQVNTMPFVIYVVKSVYTDDDVIGTNDFGELTRTISAAQEAVADVQEAIASMSVMYTSMYKFKGSVNSYSNLPSSNVEVGDVYNVSDTGMNYAWTGSVWDSLGQIIDTSTLLPKSDVQVVSTADIDDMFAD